MELNLRNKFFIVCGGTSGFGLAISKILVAEGAHVLVIARNREKLDQFENEHRDLVTTFTGDVTDSGVIQELSKKQQ
ncbi:MAG: SDR family oxidoreductase [Bacteroidales bacterium]|nr:SDR family oxidoreductase [Bacteroidales bacterium]